MVLEAPLVAADVVQWLYSEAPQLKGTLEIVSELGERLRAGGVPVDRVTTGIWVVHPNVRAEGSIWRSSGAPELILYTADAKTSEDYLTSPIKKVHETQQAGPCRDRARPGGRPGLSDRKGPARGGVQRLHRRADAVFGRVGQGGQLCHQGAGRVLELPYQRV